MEETSNFSNHFAQMAYLMHCRVNPGSHEATASRLKTLPSTEFLHYIDLFFKLPSSGIKLSLFEMRRNWKKIEPAYERNLAIHQSDANFHMGNYRPTMWYCNARASHGKYINYIYLYVYKRP